MVCCLLEDRNSCVAVFQFFGTDIYLCEALSTVAFVSGVFMSCLADILNVDCLSAVRIFSKKTNLYLGTFQHFFYFKMLRKVNQMLYSYRTVIL